MTRITSTQSGFAVLETVLILVIVAIIGGTGYYVYHANKKSNDVLKTSSAKSSNSGANGGKGGGDAHSQTGPAKTEAFVIPEWSVSSEFPTPPENAALIQYQINNGSPVTASFTTQELLDVDSSCSAGRGPAGLIARAAPTDPFYLEDGTPSGKTVQQWLTSNDNTFKPYKKVGSYYYWYNNPQSGCGDPSKTKTLQSAAEAQVKQIVSHLQAGT